MKNNLLTDRLAYTGDSLTPTHIHHLAYQSTDIKTYTYTSPDEMQTVPEEGRTHWIQIHGLRDTESIRKICAVFRIPFLTVQDILNNEHPSKIEANESYRLIIAKYFQDEEPVQVALLQGNNFVLAFLENESDFFDEIAKALHENILKARSRGADFLLTLLLNHLAAHYVSLATDIGEKLEDMEEQLIADRNTGEIGAQIQTQRRRYLSLKRTVSPLKEQYSKLSHHGTDNELKSIRPFFDDVYDHLSNAMQQIEICRETIASLMELYFANNDLRMNAIMKRLTIVSTIFIPLTFMTGIWGMNFQNMPELGWYYGYPAAWGAMILITLLVWLYFRTGRWK